MKNIVCFGEVLWDMLPTGKKLGGAPLNVSLRAQSLGNQSRVISAIGSDDQGTALLNEMKAHKASLQHIQVSENYDTSEVLVQLDKKGLASYEIKMPCAWDDIRLRLDDIKAARESNAFIYGSLIAREQTSRDTLFKLLDVAPHKVFDVNLRPPHYSIEGLIKLMNRADMVKFNDDEITEICADMGCRVESLEGFMKFITKNTNASIVCVTRGDKGGVLYTHDTFYYNKGYKIKVADTVGAGDSFLATIVSKLLNGESPQKALDYACAIGALVASKSGANPEISSDEINSIMQTQ
jgi:fructokinase